jgi:transcriptional regulator with XRE-family HTH domain
MSIFGERLRKLRESIGINQTDFGAKFNLSHNAIGMYERGSREPNMEKIILFADFFGVSIDYLYGRTNDKQKIFQVETRELMDMLHLSDDELFEMRLYTVDGKPLTKEDFINFITQVRAKRQLELERNLMRNCLDQSSQ